MPLPVPLVELLPASLQALCRSVSHPAGTVMFLKGAQPRWMYFVSQGEVVLERHGAQGQAACLQRCQAGFVGEASLTSSRYHCDGRTTRDTLLTAIPIQALRQALKDDAAFAQRWISMLGQEVRRLRRQNERLSLPKVQDRLLHLIETEGEDGIYRLEGPLMQVARQLAVTHEALYRSIAQLVAAGRIERTADRLALKRVKAPARR